MMRRIQSFVRIALLLCLLALVVMPLSAAIVDPDDGAHVGIRVYEGIDPDDMDEIVHVAADGFLPIISQAEGFIAYFLLPMDDTLAAVNIFTTAEEAEAANAAAADFVAENLAPLLPNAPTVTLGELNIFYIAPLDDEAMVDDDMAQDHDDDDDGGEGHADDEDGHDHDMDDDSDSLFAALRIYSGYDATDHAATVLRTNSIFLPLQKEMEGFFGYLFMHDGADTLAAMSIYDNQENAEAANEEAAEFVAEFFADILPDDPMTVTGSLGIAGVAGVEDGANLIDLDAMDDDDHDHDEEDDDD